VTLEKGRRSACSQRTIGRTGALGWFFPVWRFTRKADAASASKQSRSGSRRLVVLGVTKPDAPLEKSPPANAKAMQKKLQSAIVGGRLPIVV